jgi:hypothetical protein
MRSRFRISSRSLDLAVLVGLGGLLALLVPPLAAAIGR